MNKIRFSPFINNCHRNSKSLRKLSKIPYYYFIMSKYMIENLTEDEEEEGINKYKDIIIELEDPLKRCPVSWYKFN